jgi:carboxyl-terminal processing protease
MNTRRRFLLTAAAPLLLPHLSRAQAKPAVYEKDVDFLLRELPKKAGQFFTLKKIDWKKVTDQFAKEAKTVKDDAAHVKLCSRLVARLRDGHAGLRDLKVTLPDESKGRRFTGPRVHLVVIGEKVFVRQSFKDAVAKGIEVGMEVERIDNKSARKWLDETVQRLSDERGYGTDAAALYAACHAGLADWEGTTITFEVSKKGRRTKVPITRNGGPNYAPEGPVFLPKGVTALDRHSYGKTPEGYGYIHLRKVPGELPQQLDTMLAALGEVPGLILDCRANSGGGCDHEAVFARFLPAGKKWRQYTGAGLNPCTAPMVVIVDAGVISAGETIAGQFKEDGRAYMIGDSATAGSSSSKETLTVPSGLFSVFYSVHSNKARFNAGKGIEGLGVPPHELTPYLPADLEKAVDTQIRLAAEKLKTGLPKDKVPWKA